MVVSMFVRQQAAPTVKTQNHDDLVALKALVEAGTITPVIDSTYPLHETAKAIGRVAAGRTRGTIVITMPEALTTATVGPMTTVANASVAQPAQA
jgi:NADPH:quinone reductase-like Zn-dependent oxidoreductase